MASPFEYRMMTVSFADTISKTVDEIGGTAANWDLTDVIGVFDVRIVDGRATPGGENILIKIQRYDTSGNLDTGFDVFLLCEAGKETSLGGLFPLGCNDYKLRINIVGQSMAGGALTTDEHIQIILTYFQKTT